MRLARGLSSANRGDVFVEYLLVMALLALPVAGAAVRLGFPLLRLLRFTQLSMAGPFP